MLFAEIRLMFRLARQNLSCSMVGFRAAATPDFCNFLNLAQLGTF